MDFLKKPKLKSEISVRIFMYAVMKVRSNTYNMHVRICSYFIIVVHEPNGFISFFTQKKTVSNIKMINGYFWSNT